MSDSRERFARIYNEHQWGGESKSGPGSSPHLLTRYLTLLARLMRELGVRSVVDVGCGDWSLAKTVDWSGISYTGVDIVPELVDHLNRHHGSENVRFICANAVTDPLPCADLCVSKDVLQHLSNASVKRFLCKLEGHYRYALITNDIVHQEKAGWRRLWKSTSMAPNYDIADGAYRPVCLTCSPFDLRAKRLVVLPFTFPREVLDTAGTVYETKEVLLWEQNNA
jgi:SAM-dependent methyltransferase